MSLSVYVWYRVLRDDRETETLLRSMMARLGCRSGVRGRLLKKLDEPRLWMEAYDDVADREGFAARLAQLADEYDVEMFLDGPRRVEWFGGEAVAPACAVAD